MKAQGNPAPAGRVREHYILGLSVNRSPHVQLRWHQLSLSLSETPNEARANAIADGPDGAPGKPLFDKGAYFIGKAVWGKGYSELLERLAEQKAVRDGVAMPIDIYGTGEDLDEARPVLVQYAYNVRSRLTWDCLRLEFGQKLRRSLPRL